MTNHGLSETERRAFTRMRIGLDVTVAVEGRPPGRYRTRDLDLGGLFIEGGGLDLYPNDVVGIGFPGSAGRARRHAFRARVVRHAGDGVALRFDEHDEASLVVLRDVMIGAMPAVDAYATIRGKLNTT